MIHVFPPGPGHDHWCVWTDCEEGHHKTGRCIGIAPTKYLALIQARRELTTDVQQLGLMIADEMKAIIS